MKSSFGALIRAARVSVGWPQHELARRIGVTASYITKIETDQTVPGAERAVALGVELGLETDRLLQLIEEQRQTRLRQRMQTRVIAVHSFARIAPGKTRPVHRDSAPTASAADQLARAILADNDLRLALIHLQSALANPQLKPAVLKTLEVFATQKVRRRRDGGS